MASCDLAAFGRLSWLLFLCFFLSSLCRFQGACQRRCQWRLESYCTLTRTMTAFLFFSSAATGAGAISRKDLLPLLGLAGGNTSISLHPSTTMAESRPATVDSTVVAGGTVSSPRPFMTPHPATAIVASPVQTTASMATSSPASPPSMFAVSQASSRVDKTWEVVGIAVIAVLFVAILMVCAMFLNRLSRFAKDICCCYRTRSSGSEEFIPDWDVNWDLDSTSLFPQDASKNRAGMPPWNAVNVHHDA